MKRLVVFTALALAAAPATAGAGLLELTAQLQTGGQGGTGVFGGQKDNAFHAGAAPFQYGAIVGVEFMFVDVWVEHNQTFDGSTVDGTWTQFMTGIDFSIDVGNTLLDPKKKDSPTKSFVELGAAIGYGVGTGQQVDPPLDRSELTDQGFVAQVSLDFGYRLNSVMSLGLHIPLQFGYIIKTGAGVANDEENHYGSVHGAALVNFRTNFAFK